MGCRVKLARVPLPMEIANQNTTITQLVARRESSMSHRRIVHTLGTCLTLAFGALLPACSAGEGYNEEDADLVGAPQFETHGEALFYEKAGSCGNYEAESMTRVGGSATTD